MFLFFFLLSFVLVIERDCWLWDLACGRKHGRRSGGFCGASRRVFGVGSGPAREGMRGAGDLETGDGWVFGNLGGIC